MGVVMQMKMTCSSHMEQNEVNLFCEKWCSGGCSGGSGGSLGEQTKQEPTFVDSDSQRGKKWYLLM